MDKTYSGRSIEYHIVLFILREWRVLIYNKIESEDICSNIFFIVYHFSLSNGEKT
jgi:hypothetical protein